MDMAYELILNKTAKSVHKVVGPICSFAEMIYVFDDIIIESKHCIFKCTFTFI